MSPQPTSTTQRLIDRYWSDFTTFQRQLDQNIDTYGTLTVLLSLGNVFLLGVLYIDLTAEIEETSITLPLLLGTLIINLWSWLALSSTLKQRRTTHPSTTPRSLQEHQDQEPVSPLTVPHG